MELIFVIITIGESMELYDKKGNLVVIHENGKFFQFKEEKIENFAIYKKIASIESHVLRNLEIVEINEMKFKYKEEFIMGETLRTELSNKLLNESDWIKIINDLFDAVNKLHQNNIIHRDIKPENIIIKNYQATLIDYNISRFFISDKKSDTTLFGTRGYAPPEQFGYMQTDYKADLYALGKVIVEIAPNLSSDLTGFIYKSTEFDPKNRFKNVNEMQISFNKIVKAKNNRWKNYEQEIYDIKIWINEIILSSKVIYLILIAAMISVQIDDLTRVGESEILKVFYGTGMFLIYLNILKNTNVTPKKRHLNLTMKLFGIYITSYFLIELLFIQNQ